MLEFRRFIRAAMKSFGEWFATFIVNRELFVVTVILTTYMLGIAAIFSLIKLSVIDERSAVAFTISASCIAFLLAQVAFISRAKNIERHFQVKGTLANLMEQVLVDDHCILAYVSIGDQKARIIQESRKVVETAQKVILELSLLAIQTCKNELIDMLKSKRIERSGNLAYLLTKECYQFAKSNVHAVAIASDASLEFWTQTDGIGHFFYDCNRSALERGVQVARYFVFSMTDCGRLASDPTYKASVALALEQYNNRLSHPNSSLFLACRREDWRGHYPETHSGDSKRVRSNGKFKAYYGDAFPDVSLFDDSVASMWHGPSGDKVDEVRIAWEPMHVACVRDVFNLALAGNNAIIVKIDGTLTISEVLASFLASVSQCARRPQQNGEPEPPIA